MRFFLILFVALAGNPEMPGQDYRFACEPVSPNSGFKMEDYWIWGGSVIKVDSTYHMFASRWPRDEPFPVGYTAGSEIVRATSPSAEGPYEFREVVIGERDSMHWDSNMAHNPTIHKIGEQYVLFYIGSDFRRQEGWPPFHRAIGYAVADRIDGPWNRSAEPVIAQESNNPAIYVEEDGSIKLMFRSADLKVFLATSDSYSTAFSIVNSDVWPTSRLEDFYLFRINGQYHCICEDNEGKVSGHVRWGIDLRSRDGITGWLPSEPLIVYDHTIQFDDGTTLQCNRRERPQLLITGNKITHLMTGVYDGKDSWCQPVKLAHPITTD